MRGAPPLLASAPPHPSVAQAYDELFAELAATRYSRAWQRHQARRNRLRRARAACAGDKPLTLCNSRHRADVRLPGPPALRR